MCKLYISNMLCLFVSGIIPQRLFFFFLPEVLPLPVLKTARFWGNFKANNGSFLANFR